MNQNIGKQLSHFSLVFFLSCFVLIALNFDTYAQQDSTKYSKKEIRKNKQSNRNAETTRAKVTYNKQDSTHFKQDTAQLLHTDISPLDIGSNRGIFILSANRMLQLRILGSVRARFDYSDQVMQDE